MLLTISASTHFIVTALSAIVPLAVAAFLAGRAIAWIVWGLIKRRGDQ